MAKHLTTLIQPDLLSLYTFILGTRDFYFNYMAYRYHARRGSGGHFFIFLAQLFNNIVEIFFRIRNIPQIVRYAMQQNSCQRRFKFLLFRNNLLAAARFLEELRKERSEARLREKVGSLN